ncbi:MAG: hypothetical protein K1X28_08075 [Parachlamydiales bacterium]|nr:hypothetical protein [Parachlamydiales bacterium]
MASPTHRRTHHDPACTDTNHAHSHGGKEHTHDSETRMKRVLVAGVIAVVGMLLWYMNRSRGT